jgi:cytidylate kinase
LARKHDVVLDGRDIGTVVFPNATLKLFLTASDDIRAKRRFEELKATNPNFEDSLEQVKANLLERDYIDAHREDSPLEKAHDAIEIDNSHLTVDDQLKVALTLLERAK